MKVIKVIVDEMPDSCGFCPLCGGVKNRQKYITERELFCNVRFEYLTYENMMCRPDWCPLMTQKRLLKLWEYAETGNWDYESEDE